MSLTHEERRFLVVFELLAYGFVLLFMLLNGGFGFDFSIWMPSAEPPACLWHC